MQQELFTAYSEPKSIDGNFCILQLLEEIKSEKLQVPKFQRGYVWSKEKLKGWAETIISGMAIGVIVTYQLKGGSPKFIADGLQRLTATARFLENPKEYGFDFGPEQAMVYCESFMIPVQNRVYNGHPDAMIAFHNLNAGTSLTPLEYYRGLLKTDTKGTIIFDKIPNIIFSAEYPLVSGKKPGRDALSKLTRDALALFFQYLSETTQIFFWHVEKQKIRPVKDSLELKILNHIKNMSQDEIDKKISSFEQFINEHIKEISAIIQETEQAGKLMSRTVIRFLLHTAIWRKNAKKSGDLYLRFVRRFIEIQIPYRTFSSRFSLPDTDPVQIISISIGSLQHLKKLSTALDVPLYEGYKRKPRETARGYHNSHVVPLSKHGEGETIIEPGLRNRVRGAQPIFENLPLDNLTEM